jgi:hypothetical protein
MELLNVNVEQSCRGILLCRRVSFICVKCYGCSIWQRKRVWPVDKELIPMTATPFMYEYIYYVTLSGCPVALSSSSGVRMHAQKSGTSRSAPVSHVFPFLSSPSLHAASQVQLLRVHLKRVGGEA